MIIQVRGGLGSQMFAYALGLSVQKKQRKATIDFSGYLHNQNQHNGPEINRIFGLPEYYNDGLWSTILYSPKFYLRFIRKALKILGVIYQYTADKHGYHFDEEVFKLNEKTYVYQSWTSWKYFDGIFDEIRAVYKFPLITDIKNAEVLTEIRNSNSVALHVRRGDYEKHTALGGLCGKSYYKEALSKLRDLTKGNLENKFFIFSNDPEWCRQNFSELDAVFVDWNGGKNSYIDMQLMSECNHQIIPNSSFSWWSAFLNRNPKKIVIAPRRWSNPESGVNLVDMNMPSWHLIDN